MDADSRGDASSKTSTIKPVRLLGEDLTLYKDLSGTFGLVDRQCPHRRADTSYGFVEQCGLRCNYHGWLFDQDGRCTEQPYEDVAAPEARFKDKVRIKAYPVETRAGLIWAYLGPQPAPLVPNWEPFTWKNGFVQIVFADLPCNWLQCQENSIDPLHFEWMHMNWSVRLDEKLGPYSPRHLKLEFEEFDYGFVYRRIREGMSESDPMWTVGRVCLWPNALFTGDHFEWRVPVDDEHTLSVTWAFSRVPKESEAYVQEQHPGVARPGYRCGRPLDIEPRHESGLRRMGGPGNHRGSDPGAPGDQRPRRPDAAQAFPERSGSRGQGRGSQRPSSAIPRSTSASPCRWPSGRFSPRE